MLYDQELLASRQEEILGIISGKKRARKQYLTLSA
jgi:hypothetical protein